VSDLTHLNARGEARMVDIATKPDSARRAVATARVRMSAATLEKMLAGNLAKGDVFGTARIAGIMAAKQCANLIPLCHPLPLSSVELEFHPDPAAPGLDIVATCRTSGKTGVEMEALTAVAIAALTVYDMGKALEKGMVIEAVRLVEKEGGKSGHWQAADRDGESA